MTGSPDQVEAAVRRRYAAAAMEAASECVPTACDPGDSRFGAGQYTDKDTAADPGAAQASLGCGNPLAVADLNAGETVLDLGSGAGLDVLLSARRVGPTGRAIGLDMTTEMLDLARRNAADAGIRNVEFLAGRIEAIPLPDASVDVVISNCVVNLSADKPCVFAEIARVLRAGGRLGLSDLVVDDDADPDAVHGATASVGPGVRPLQAADYRRLLAEAGLVDIEIVPTHAVAGGVNAAIVRARRGAQN